MRSAHFGDHTSVEIGGARLSVRWGLGGHRFRRVGSENSVQQWKWTPGRSDPAERPRARCGSVTGAGPAPASSGASPLRRVGTTCPVRGKQGPPPGVDLGGSRWGVRTCCASPSRGIAGPLQTSTLRLAQAQADGVPKRREGSLPVTAHQAVTAPLTPAGPQQVWGAGPGLSR